MAGVIYWAMVPVHVNPASIGVRWISSQEFIVLFVGIGAGMSGALSSSISVDLAVLFAVAPMRLFTISVVELDWTTDFVESVVADKLERQSVLTVVLL
jgi:hypothetical protein